MFSIQKMVLGNLSTNCYILTSDTLEGHAMVVDPATSPELILDNLKKQNLILDRILLTHGHFDHIGAVDALVEVTGAPFFVSEKDAEILDDPKMNSSDKFDYEVTVHSVPSVLLKEGDIISFGEDTLKVMETPGHTRGSIAFYTDTFVISGDTLFYHNFGRFDLAGGSLLDIRRSLGKLIKLPPETVVYPGHGITTTIGDENQYLFKGKD